MRKYFLLIIIIIAIIAVAGIILKHYDKKYPHEIGAIKNSSAPAFTLAPVVSPNDDKGNKKKSLVVILSPHFDDAVLSLGGFLAGNQSETEVDTFFGGKPSHDFHTEWDKISGFRDSDEAVPSRAIEDGKALGEFALTGKNYDYLDYQYREKGHDQEIVKSIEKDIESVILEHPAKKIFVYGPADFGSKITHPDHRILHQALIEAARENKNPDVEFLIYEDFPYVRRFNQSGSEKLKDYLEKEDNLNIQEKDIEIGEAGFSKKIKALRDYASQIAAFGFQGSDIVSLAESFSRERCKAAHPNWYACEAVYNIQF